MYTNIMRDRFNPGTDLTALAASAITGKTFTAYAGPMRSGNITVATAEPGAATAGVAKYDANAEELVGIARGSGRVVTVTTAADLAAGDPIAVGDNGHATLADTGIIVGWAADNADAGTDALVSLAH